MEAGSAIGPVMQLVGVGLNTYSQVAASDVHAKPLQAQARSMRSKPRLMSGSFAETRASWRDRTAQRLRHRALISISREAQRCSISLTWPSNQKIQPKTFGVVGKSPPTIHALMRGWCDVRFPLTLRAGLQKGQYLNQIGREMTPSPDHIVAATHTTPTGRDKWLGHCSAHGS